MAALEAAAGCSGHAGWCQCLLLAILLAPAAHAQFDLFLVEGNTERAAPAVYDFGSLYAERIGLRALPPAQYVERCGDVEQSWRSPGVGFTLTSPALPVGLAPQAAIDLSVVFRATDTGAYSASLHSEGIAILLTATVAPRLTYRVDPSGGAAFPGTLDFGSVVRGTGAERRITIQNETPLVLTIPAISVQGADFALRGTALSGQALRTAAGRGIQHRVHAAGYRCAAGFAHASATGVTRCSAPASIRRCRNPPSRSTSSRRPAPSRAR